MRSLRAYAPASVGNFAAGFDLMGAALAPVDGSPLGDIVELAPATATTFTLSGPQAEALAGLGDDNLVMQSFRLYREALEAKGLPCGPVALHLVKHLPVQSGLGSSASSIVATLTALQVAFDAPLSLAELIALAGRAEGLHAGSIHLDNVAPSLLGGLQLLVPGRFGGPPVVSRALPWPEDLLVAVAHPHRTLPTAHARTVLPPELPLGEALTFAQNLAAFVHALHTRDFALLGRCLRDPLAESHRAHLVPGFREIQASAMAAGAMGCTLSGAGPTLFAVAEGEARTAEVLAAMVEACRRTGADCDGRLCRLDPEGARVIP